MQLSKIDMSMTVIVPPVFLGTKTVLELNPEWVTIETASISLLDIMRSPSCESI